MSFFLSFFLSFFQKFSNFSHMVWVVSGPAWGCCFTSIKVCSSHTNSLRKSEKTVQKVGFLACGGPPIVGWARKQQFSSCFFRFSQRVRVWRVNLYRGETTPPSRSRNNPYHVWKVWGLLKKSNFWKNFDHFYGLPPIIVNHCLWTFQIQKALA